MGAFNNETDQPVALIDVYHEFNDVIAPNLGLKEFKSRKVSKNYAFNPDIPLQSEYLEVKYSVCLLYQKLPYFLNHFFKTALISPDNRRTNRENVL